MNNASSIMIRVIKVPIKGTFITLKYKTKGESYVRSMA